ncbi:MAG: TRAP transporter TatT component family protein [Acidobacteriota bacterium]
MRKLAVRTLADSLAGGEVNVFASDDDPELIGQALPFALKTLEALLKVDPENAELLLATCSSFTQYTYAFSELKAERLQPTDYRGSRRERERATRLYLRARDYCFRALDQIPELRDEGAAIRLRRDTQETLKALGQEHVPALFWTAASWGSAISNGRHRVDLIIDLDVVRQVLSRCLELDPDYGDGLVHDAFISLEALPAAMGGSYERAEYHYKRAVELHRNRRVGSHLNWAWLVAIGQQDRESFDAAIEKALAVDVTESPQDRLANEVNRDFAIFLRGQADELFLDDLTGEE